MFYFKNNRFHIANISFSLPDGCVLAQKEHEEFENGIRFTTEDGKLKITVRPIYIDDETIQYDAYEYFKELIDGYAKEFRFCSDIIPIEKYGLKGYTLSHASSWAEYYDERYDIIDDKYGIRVLEISIYAYKGMRMEEAMKHPMTIAFLESCREEFQER